MYVHTISLKAVSDLYRKYAQELKQVREEQRKLYSSGFLSQYDDEEAEITYLLIRAIQPTIIVEISPCKGWSTSWILRALGTNEKGTCYSYELFEENLKWAKRNIPKGLQSRWKCFVGRVQDRLQDIPPKVDYLLLDSDHSQTFARWYINKLFPRVHGIVSVHDVFHIETWGEPSKEGKEVIRWLGNHNIEFFSPSLPFLHNYREIERLRREIGLGPPIHKQACGGARLVGYLSELPIDQWTLSHYAYLFKAVIKDVTHTHGKGSSRAHCNPSIFFYLEDGLPDKSKQTLERTRGTSDKRYASLI